MAITAGSRGIANIAEILKVAVTLLVPTASANGTPEPRLRQFTVGGVFVMFAASRFVVRPVASGWFLTGAARSAQVQSAPSRSATTSPAV